MQFTLEDNYRIKNKCKDENPVKCNGLTPCLVCLTAFINGMSPISSVLK